MRTPVRLTPLRARPPLRARADVAPFPPPCPWRGVKDLAAASLLAPLSGLSCKMAVPWRIPRRCEPGNFAGLTVEPKVFEPPAVVDAVDHDRQPLDVGLPAARGAVMKNNRPGAVFLQFAVDLPHELFALLSVGFHRLKRELFFEFRVAVAGDVPLRAAGIVLEELLVRIVDRGGGEIEAYYVILADRFWKPIHRFDWVEFGVDIDGLQLVDQDDSRVARYRDVADRQF